MPLFYTHIRYGNKCLDLLQDEYKEIIENNYAYFLCGVQGPNIFKYHSPITNKNYLKLSEQIHNNPIANTLKFVKTEIKNSKNRDAILSYTLGYITHFVLDSYTNSYLLNSSKIVNTNVNALKSEIEKYYIHKENINISRLLNKYKISNNLKITISKILNSKEIIIKQSLSNMVQYSKILYIKNNKLLNFINAIMKLKCFDKYRYLFVNDVQIKNTSQILRFEKYFEISKYHCQILLNNYINYIFNDEKLDSYFFNTFELLNNEPILTFEEEKQYIIKNINK